jgi:predicted nucleic acid-binding protein
MRYGIVSDNKVLVDTSIWIAYFKNSHPQITERVDDVLTHSDVHVPKVVIAELIQGAKSEREIAVIEEFVNAFTVIDQNADTWLKAGRLSFSMKKKGITVHIIDCYIAILANEYHCSIFSLDAHFKGIQKFLKLDLL